MAAVAAELGVRCDSSLLPSLCWVSDSLRVVLCVFFLPRNCVLVSMCPCQYTPPFQALRRNARHAPPSLPFGRRCGCPQRRKHVVCDMHGSPRQLRLQVRRKPCVCPVRLVSCGLVLASVPLVKVLHYVVYLTRRMLSGIPTADNYALF